MPEKRACEVRVATQQLRQCIQSSQVLFQWDRNSCYWYFLSSSALAGFQKRKKKGKWSGLGNLANTEKNVCKHCTYCLCTRVSGHVRASTRVDVFFSTALWKRSERALPTLPSQDLTRWQWPRIPQLRSASVCLSWTRWKQHYQDLALPQALAFEGANPAVSLWDLFLVWEDLAKRKTFHFSVAFVA